MNKTPYIADAEGGAELWELASRACNDALSPEDLVRLETLLSEDRQSRDFFGFYMLMHAELTWRFRGDEDSGAGVRDSERPVGSAVELPHRPDVEFPDLQPPASSLQPSFPPIIVSLPSPIPSPLFSLPSIGSWSFSYTAATVIVGLFLLGAWAYKITHHNQFAADGRGLTAPGESAQDRPEMVFVGRITGMAGVKWSADPHYLPPIGFAHVPLGRKYKLDAGLMQITYDSGAKVILEGPCSYEVDSSAGGYLALGKLTARIGERGEGKGKRGKGSRSKVQGSKSANPKSPNPQISKSPNPFVIHTPTAIVTDLGTEFGVEVGEEGNTSTHVFQGKVELRSAGGGDVTLLGENEAATVKKGQGRVVKMIRESGQPNAFARRMPVRVRIKLFNTGVGVKEGDADPHWQLVARSDDPDFKPQPAIVTRAGDDPTRSQWISAVGDLAPLPDNVIYTFRTTFDLTGTLPNTASLIGKFLADDHVSAIRLNGRNLPVPNHRWGLPFIHWAHFKASSGFVEGTNVLEIDVWNKFLHDLDDRTGPANPMTCRVELKGYVVCAPAGTAEKKGTGPISRNGPEGASQKLDLTPFSPRQQKGGDFIRDP